MDVIIMLVLIKKENYLAEEMEKMIKDGLLDYTVIIMKWLLQDLDTMVKEKNSIINGEKNVILECYMILKQNHYHIFLINNMLEHHSLM
jgi:hypothetical protein